MPRAIVGTFLVGTRLVGENSLQFAKSQLQLQGRTFSLVVANATETVVFPSSPKLQLLPQPFSLRVNQTVVVSASPKLQLVGRAFTVSTSQSLGLGSARLLLVGRSYGFVISQSWPFGKPVLLLVGRPPRRVGVPWLLPTVPATIILTPSPAEVTAILVPTVAETKTLVPTEVKVG